MRRRTIKSSMMRINWSRRKMVEVKRRCRKRMKIRNRTTIGMRRTIKRRRMGMYMAQERLVSII